MLSVVGSAKIMVLMDGEISHWLFGGPSCGVCCVPIQAYIVCHVVACPVGIVVVLMCVFSRHVPLGYGFFSSIVRCMCCVLAIVIIGTHLMATGPGPSGWYVQIHLHECKAAAAV